MEQTINLTEEQIEEIGRCYYDPIYFILNYVWIELKETGQIIPFELYPYQLEILDWLINRKSGLVLKSRRVGASTVVAAYLAWLINFRRGINALLISINEEKAKKLLSKVKFNLFNLRKRTSDKFELCSDASWMLNTFPINNQQLLASGWMDDDGSIVSVSEIASLTTTETSGRGDSATFVFMDELAFLPDQEALMGSARLTAMRGGHWLAVSTPNGVGDLFHSMCMTSQRGENKTYNFRRIHWTEANITEDEVMAGTEGLSEGLIAQELEMEFLSSGDPVFNHMHLAACYKPPALYPEVDESLKSYKIKNYKSVSDFPYYSGVDSALGKHQNRASKRDYHSFTAVTKDGIQAVHYYSKDLPLKEWAGNIETLPSVGVVKMEGQVSKLHRDYPGICQIEVNGPGQMVYNNHQVPLDGFSQVIPKTTTTKTKNAMAGYINQLVLAIESHAIVITDPFTYECLSVYQRGSTPGTFSAPVGNYFDDPVISLALAWDALLQSGAIEFSWGSTTDDLQQKEYTSDEINDINLLNSSYGPAIFRTADSNERLSNYLGDAHLIPDSDLELSRIREPEFINEY